MKSTFIYLALIVTILSSCSRYENFAGYEDTSEDSPSELTLASSKMHSTMEADLFELINNYRISVGLNPFEFESISYYYATLHTNYMISKGITSHDMFTKRASGISKRTDAVFVAENVARNYDTIEEAFDAWLDSEGHRKNLEGDFNYSAISIVENSNGDYYFTQIFVKQ
ncbi:CAP domain-containing protein [Maribacter forsetii]|uniref:CAP domain-containing protein n=1 Tax=Maribacter forsetii TaxID=444515 RepID=UPI000569B8C0|nr:CAP domain-containing protein [Maribacter forsetii]